MAVNRASKPRRAGSVEQDLRELVRLFGSVVHGLKRGPEGSTEVPLVLREAFEQSPLGPRHAPVLMTVTFEGPLSVSELAERLGLTVGTTSLLVGELNRAGLLDRAEDERDRRRTIVQLPPAHREDMDAWARQRLEPMRRALERMSSQQRAQFMEGWRILAEETATTEPGDRVDCDD
jgi:DNA-binding MarR family transcriptional regulator